MGERAVPAGGRQREVIRVLNAATPEEISAVRALFREYAGSLGVDLSFQDFASELADLPGAYVPPAGALLLALDGDLPVGCVALRPWEEDIAELKRLYVSPAARGTGLGGTLSRSAIETARAAGYERVRLDTLPTMTSAQRLYEGLGFVEIEPYRFNPIPGTRYMELVLTRAG